jgi:hypothetical protein
VNKMAELAWRGIWSKIMASLAVVLLIVDLHQKLTH